GGDGFAAVLTYGDSDELAAYAQLARANASTVIELVVAPDARQFTNDLTVGLLRSALDVVASSGGGRVNWWVHHPVLGTDAVATEMGFELGRRLLQMRRDLPIQQPGGSAPTVATRSFVIGRDETEWLRVNNAAFHGHPEQGGWTAEMLRQRETEPWFDPDGFRLHERDGKLAAFCWTKIHADAVPAVGEIYVIAVDPEFHGLGLGKALTIAGLAYLGDHGLIVGMLHVDAANTAAMATYERLGFSIHHEDHAYVTTLTGAHP
ncbi:MAG: mycothiol synthase, partial [Ilumatobacteraceae bacterium]